MIDLLIVVNLTLMALVFGYGFAATSVSYPAMMASQREVAVGYFKPFFHKSNHLQLTLSMLVLGVSLILSFLGQGWLWAIAGTVLQLSGQYTIKVLMPVNNRIMADGADIHSEQMKKDLGQWGKLHLPRTLLAGLVFILFAFLAVSGT